MQVTMHCAHHKRANKQSMLAILRGPLVKTDKCEGTPILSSVHQPLRNLLKERARQESHDPPGNQPGVTLPSKGLLLAGSNTVKHPITQGRPS